MRATAPGAFWSSRTATPTALHRIYYAQIDVVDFRNYNYGLDQLIADNDYDQILVLYSFDSFKSDPYLYRAGVAG